MTGHIDSAVSRAVDHRVPVAKIGVLVMGIVLLAACGGGDEEEAAAGQAPTNGGTASGSAMLSWYAPTQNTDGSPYTDAAGYRIYWGTSQGGYTNSHTLNGVGLQTYVVESLTPGTWYFVVTARDSDGNESGYSNVAQKTVM